MAARVVDAGLIVGAVTKLLSIPGPAIAIAPLITGDPTDALPPGFDVQYGSDFAIIINGEVVFGNKNVQIWDPDATY